MKPIFTFTKQEISDELYELIQRLENGESIELEEFEDTEEFIVANGMTHGGVETIYLKGREKIQQRVFDDMIHRGSIRKKDGHLFFDGDVKAGKRLDVVIGLPASGKSSSVAEKISEEIKALLLDNDEIKKLLPGYCDGWGDNLVHQESKKINRRIIDEAIRSGKNIVLPKIGGYIGEIQAIMKHAKENGYTVNLHYVDLDRNKAVLRLLYRFIRDGRFIPPSTIYRDNNEIDGNKIKKVFDELVQSGIVDGYSIWNNDVKKGEKPILIEAANLTDNFIVNANMQAEPHKTIKLILRNNHFSSNKTIHPLSVFEQSFLNKYGKEKFIFFKQLEYLAKNNKNINIKQFNPDFSYQKLKLLLAIQMLGLKIKNASGLTEKQMLDIIKDNDITFDESLTEKISRHKKEMANDTVENLQKQTIKTR